MAPGSGSTYEFEVLTKFDRQGIKDYVDYALQEMKRLAALPGDVLGSKSAGVAGITNIGAALSTSTQAAKQAGARPEDIRKLTAALRVGGLQVENLGASAAEGTRNLRQFDIAVNKAAASFTPAAELAKTTAQLVEARREEIRETLKNIAARQANIPDEAQLQVARAQERASIGASAVDVRQEDPRAAKQEINDLAAADADSYRRDIDQRTETARLLDAEGKKLVNQEAAVIAAEKNRALAVKERVQQITGTATLDREVKLLVAQEASAQKRKLGIIKATLENQGDLLATEGRLLIETKRLEQARKAAAQAALAQVITKGAAGGDPLGQGTGFQRLQASVAARSGNLRLPAEFQTLKQFMTSRLITTAGFAASGAVLYGGTQFVRELISEAENLQKEMAIVEGQLSAVDKAAEFPTFRASIIDISKETGVAADRVAGISRQLAGIFRETSPEGEDLGPDLPRVTQEAEVALKFSQVTGITDEQINDELSAIKISFEEQFSDLGEGVSAFQLIADEIVNTENKMGVLSGEILEFTADLAPLASELGFTTQQLEGLGAVALRASGKSVGAISENFGRVFADLPQKTAELVGFFNRIPELADNLPDLTAATGAEDYLAVFQEILRASPELAPEQRFELAGIVAGRREAQTFVTVLNQANEALEAMDLAPGAGEGSFDERWQKHTDTVAFATQQMQRTIEELGDELFRAGLGDALQTLATLGTLVANVFTDIVKILGSLNSAFGGLPVKMLAIAAAFKAIAAASQAVGLSGLLTSLGTGGGVGAGLGARASQLFAAGGLFGTVRAGVTDLGAQFRGPDGKIISNQAALRPSLQGGRFDVDPRRRATGVIAGAAPLVAAVGVAELYSTYKGVNSNIQADASAFRDGLQEAESEALERVLRERGSTAGTLMDNIEFGFLGGGKNPYQILEDELQARAGAEAQRTSVPTLQDSKFQERLDALAENLTGQFDALAGLNTTEGASGFGPEYERAVRAAEESKFAPPDPNSDYALSALAAQRDLLNRREEIIANYTQNAEDDDFARDFNALVDLAREADPAIAAEIDRLKAVFAEEQVILDQAKSASAGHAGDRLATSLARYSIGDTDFADVMSAYADAIEEQTTILDGLRIGPGNDKARAETAQAIAEYQQAQASFAAEQLNGGIDLQAAIRGIGGGGLQADIGTSTERLNALTEAFSEGGFNAAEASELATSAQEVVAAQRAAFDERISSASTAAEALAIMQGGFAVDDQARIALIIAQLNLPTVAPKIADLAERLNIGMTEARNRIVELLTGYSEEQREILRVLIENEIKMIQDLPRIAFAGDSTLTDKISELRAALDLLGDPTLNGSIVTPPETGGASPEEIQAKAEEAAKEQEAAAKEARERQNDFAKAMLEIQKANAAGDPVALANLALSEAELERQIAGQIADPTERATALARAEVSRINALQQREDAFAEQTSALRDLSLAQEGDSPLATAAREVAEAQSALDRAKGTTARAKALAALIRAQRGQRDVIADIARAQKELLIAVADAAGDTVRSASIALQIARDELNRIRRESPNDKAAILAAEANVVRQEASVRDAQLSTRFQEIDTALQLERITVGSAIAQLQALMQIPELTQQQHDEILLKIKALQSELGADLQFNLPDFITPTLYEARRLNQAGNQPGGAGGYQDNRQVTATFIITNGMTKDEAQAFLTEAVGNSRFGIRTRRY